ncbi:MAG: hypothetical protein WC972_05815 [Trueperaceae bacterium]
METQWLRTSSGDLVEINSGALVYIPDPADGASCVVLRIGGLERELYRGHEVREYVTGLARILGAPTADSLVGNGKPGERV